MLRRATYLDLPAIHALPAVVPHGADPLALAQDLDTSAIALVLEAPESSNTDEATIVAFACFGSGPPVHHFRDIAQRQLRKDGWDRVVHDQFIEPHVGRIKRSNTLFLWRVHGSTAIADPASFLLQSISSIYTISPRIHHVAHLIPNDSDPATENAPAWLASPVKRQHAQGVHVNSPDVEQPLFMQALPRQPSSPPDFVLHVNQRSHVLPPLRVRKARVEDCDDLVPLFKRHNMLPQDAGDYHVAEILESKNPNVLSLVAEANGTAIGFISVTTDVDVNALTQTFALDVYTDLLDVPMSQEKDESTRHAQLNRTASIQALSRTISSARQGDGGKAENGADGSQGNDNEGDQSPALVTTTSANSHHGSIANLVKDIKEPLRPVSSNAVSRAGGITTHQQSGAQLTATQQQHNAFAIKLFCIDDRFAHHSPELIRPLFKALPNHDYCLLTQPTHCRELPLLVAPGGGGAFTRVPTCPNKYPDHSLYLAHRLGSTSSLQVRRGSQKDMTAVHTFLDAACGTGAQQDRMKVMLQSCDAEFEPVRQTGSTFFVVEAVGQVVGVALFQHGRMDHVVAEFDIERWLEPKAHSVQDRLNTLQFFLLNPLFEGQARWVLQDMMVLAESSVIVYQCQPPFDYLSLKVLREQMVPLRPRRVASSFSSIYWPVLLMSSNIGFEPRVTVNTRMVFVGASDCNLTTIEELIFDDHIRYANLILISPEGYINPAPLLTHGLRTLSRPDCVGFPLFCSIICDSISSIVRRQQRVRLRKVGSVKYDQLVLSVGRTCAHKVLAPPNSDTSVNHIPNMIAMDVAHGHHLFKAKDRYPEGVVIVGAEPEAWHAVSVLLQNNYPTSSITHIAGPTTTWPSCLAPVASDLIAAYQRKGISLLLCEPIGLVKSVLDRVTAVTVPSDNEGDGVFAIQCGLVVLASEKHVSGTNFRVIQEACLVFDNGIVIGSAFETSDPRILATGSCTRFSRREEIPWFLQEVSSREVGQKVAKVLKPEDLDMLAKSQQEDSAAAVPPQYYTQPIERQARIAGHLDFYSFTVPAPFVSTKDLKPRAKLSTNVGSGEGEAEPGLLSKVTLTVDGHGRVSQFAYLGTRPLDLGRIRGLFGVHERYLGRLVQRFNDGMIQDLFDYLNQRQFDIVLSDRFQCAMEQMRQAALSQGQESGQSEWFEKLIELARKDSEVTQEDKEQLWSKFETSGQMGRGIADRFINDLYHSARSSIGV